MTSVIVKPEPDRGSKSFYEALMKVVSRLPGMTPEERELFIQGAGWATGYWSKIREEIDCEATAGRDSGSDAGGRPSDSVGP